MWKVHILLNSATSLSQFLELHVYIILIVVEQSAQFLTKSPYAPSDIVFFYEVLNHWLDIVVSWNQVNYLQQLMCMFGQSHISDMHSLQNFCDRIR